MEQNGAELILFGCKGLGVQFGNTLNRVSTTVQYFDLDNETLYLLDEKGNILCTIVNDKGDYESPNNQDRRIQNNKNGFDIVWLNDGNCCFVRRIDADRKGAKYLLTGMLLVCVVLLTCVLMWCIYDNRDKSRIIDNNNAQIESLKHANDSILDSNKSLQTTIENLTKNKKKMLERKNDMNSWDEREENVLNESAKIIENSKKELQGRALNYKSQLQSDDCDANTLNTVERWWKQLSEEQKQNVRDGMKNCKYYFDNAIPAYKTFFTTDQLEEMKVLLNDNNKKSVFSSNQIEIIKAYTHSSQSFKLMREQYFGNDFKMPIAKIKFSLEN